jgi:Protein of unknown function (DUF4233)
MTEPAGTPQPVDPMKGFRGVMAGTVVLEAIVVALSLLVVDRQEGGLSSWVGWTVGACIVLLVVTCGLLRRPWSLLLIAVVQAALIACVVSATAVGVIGLLFTAVWGYLLWLRRDVARRMAAGRLPSQQSSGHSG